MDTQFGAVRRMPRHEEAGERRSKPRIYTPLSATIFRPDAGGGSSQEVVELDNWGAGGLYTRLKTPFLPRTSLRMWLYLSAARAATGKVTRIEINGTVMRAELCPGGVYGIALRFTKHRFIWGQAEVAGGEAGAETRRTTLIRSDRTRTRWEFIEAAS